MFGGGPPGAEGWTATASMALSVLQAAPEPLTPAQVRRLWPSRPAPKPAAVEAALGELERSGAAARLPGKAGKPLWSPRPLADWLEEARRRILQRVDESKAPLKEKELLAAAGWPKVLDPGRLAGLLLRLEQEGALKRWPGRTPAWWRLSPEESVPELLLDVLDGLAMSRAEWLRKAKARLKGVDRERWERAAAELVAAGRVFQYTLKIDGRKVQACVRAEHRAALLELYRPMLARLREEWHRLGASEEQIARFLGGEPTRPGAARLLLEELKRLEQESPPPNPVEMLRRRPALGGLPKEEFDRAALELLAQGRVYMARHDHAMRLPEEERRQLVADGAGNFYVSITARP